MSATAPKRRDQLPECFQLEGHSGDPKVLTPARTRPDLMSLTRCDNSLADVETKLTSSGDSTTEQSAFVAPPERYVGKYRHSRRRERKAKALRNNDIRHLVTSVRDSGVRFWVGSCRQRLSMPNDFTCWSGFKVMAPKVPIPTALSRCGWGFSLYRGFQPSSRWAAYRHEAHCAQLCKSRAELIDLAIGHDARVLGCQGELADHDVLHGA